ncbi:hypothetical protein [Flavobacterium sp. K5-23]|uniref:hypothetical protein n=1 Tax=Flavobacterium sp. K5-23 TaxID=2746225 RepID=UPI00200FDD00|nr:hypothetical protein [Flavobacterium sp. K5-23]UQD56808.1 hypothetical protein FLAK523_10555 [Flavobacterium sp. K5-23]
MKKFITQFILFCLPALIAAYAFDVFVSKYLKESNSFAKKEYPVWNAIRDSKVNSDIVIYGSSRAWVHIDPKMISDSLNVSCYNLGINGHNFWLQDLRHRLLLKNNSKPKLIIHSLDAFTLQKNEDLYNAEQFLPYMLWNNQIKEATISYNGFPFVDYEIPIIRYYGRQKAINTAFELYLNPQDNPIQRISGYQGQARVWNSDFEKAKSKMKAYNVKIDTPSLHLFEDYLKECQSKKIQIVLVYTPEYIEGQKFVKNRDSIITMYNKFSKEYKIPFYDYSNDTMSYNKKYFYNSLHLNKKGAELFTHKLINTIKASNSNYK